MSAGAAYDADVIVVGAGPGGASTAAQLAAAGADVLLLERGRFPRDKVCGDFVGPVALRELDALGIGAEVEAAGNRSDRATLFIDGAAELTYVLPAVGSLRGHGRVVRRVELDAIVARAAQRAGARLVEDTAVTSLQRTEDGIAVVARTPDGQRRWHARAVVGADGSSSVVARFVHGGAPARGGFIVAVRAYYEGVAGPAERCDIAFCSDSFPGYAWIFPTAHGEANVGVGMVVDTYPAVPHRLHALLEHLIVADASMRERLAAARAISAPRGWPLAIYGGATAPYASRVLLVGDAAGLVNPLNGEGIQSALMSARLAATVLSGALRAGDLSAHGLRRYGASIRSELGNDMMLGRLVVRAIANRTLNPLWIGMLRGVVARAARDPHYALRTGGVVAGVLPARVAFAPPILARTAAAVAGRFGRAASRSIAAAALRPRDAFPWMRDMAGAVRELATAPKGER
jgi:geranylgeranyl reductase family protein